MHKDSAHGFSDYVRLLDGLLRYEHPKFTEEDLNKVEEFIDGLDEYVFHIPERLYAIRAYRLLNN